MTAHRVWALALEVGLACVAVAVVLIVGGGPRVVAQSLAWAAEGCAVVAAVALVVGTRP